jgi:hypothetical protein
VVGGGCKEEVSRNQSINNKYLEHIKKEMVDVLVKIG